MNLTLRPYQQQAIVNLRQSYRQKNRRVVLVSPTGSGKTVIAMAIVDLASVKNNGNILFIAHRREIIDQTSKKLDRIGIRHGVIMGDDGRHDLEAKVQIASIQTLVRRELPPADFIIIDECHLSIAKSYIKVIDHYGNTPVLGLTATPWRTDGQGLDKVYQDLVLVSQVKDLVRDGFLVAPDIYTPYVPTLTGVRVRNGDYVESDLTDVMDKRHLIGQIVSHWQNNALNKRTVVFACSVAHSKHITQNFLDAGVAAAHIDHHTPRQERDAVLEKLASGEIKVVSNVGILTEGWDLPQLQCAIMARPTKSRSLYLQMAGRIMRAIAGKDGAVLLDHAGNFQEHYSPIAVREYDLKAEPKKSGAKPPHSDKVCPDCYRVCPQNTIVCPNCGFFFKKENDKKILDETSHILTKVEHIPSCKKCGMQTLSVARRGYLSKYAAEYRCESCKTPNILARINIQKLTHLERKGEFNRLKVYGQIKNYSPTWAEIRYKDLFGISPTKEEF